MLPVEIDEARETKKQEVNYETKRDADLHESVNGGKCQKFEIFTKSFSLIFQFSPQKIINMD